MNAHEKGIAQATEVISAAHAYQLSYEAVEAGLRAYLEASGMVMVPREPDGEMMRAGADASPMWDTNSADTYAIAVNDVADVYLAMIAAFPSPFSQANTEGEKA